MEGMSKEVFDTQNHFRAHPKELAKVLEKLLGYFKGDTMHFPGNPVGLMTNEGPAAVHEAIEFLNHTQSLPPLKWSQSLAKAARDHAQDIGPKGITGHTGSDGSSMSDRIERYGEWEVTIAENIDFGGETAEAVVSDLVIDDGNMNRGHRKNMFNPELKVVGIATGSHAEYKHLAVCVFAGGICGEGGDGDNHHDDHHDDHHDHHDDPHDHHDHHHKHAAPAISGKIQTGSEEFDEALEDIKKGIDPHAPKDTISTKVRVNTTTEDDKIVRTMVKTYKTKNGSMKTVTLKQTTG